MTSALRRLGAKSVAHRDACLLVLTPILIVVVALSVATAVDRGHPRHLPRTLGFAASVSAATALGPLGAFFPSESLRDWTLAGALALVAILVVFARTRAGTLAWPWIFAGSFAWFSAGFLALAWAMRGV